MGCLGKWSTFSWATERAEVRMREEGRGKDAAGWLIAAARAAEESSHVSVRLAGGEPPALSG